MISYPSVCAPSLDDLFLLQILTHTHTRMLTHTHTHNTHTALAQDTNEVTFLPTIDVHPQGGIYDSGNPIILRCVATGDNLPILFTHNGVMIDESDPRRVIAVDSLTILNFSENFEGEYVCLARNQVGNSTFTVASAPALVQLRGTFMKVGGILCVCVCVCLCKSALLYIS